MTTLLAPPKFGICTRCGARKAAKNLQGGLCRGKYANSRDSCAYVVAVEQAARARQQEEQEQLRAVHKALKAAITSRTPYPLPPAIRTLGNTTTYAQVNNPRGPRAIVDAEGRVALRVCDLPVGKALLILAIAAEDFRMNAHTAGALTAIVAFDQFDSDDATVVRQITASEICSADLLKTLEAVNDHDPGQIEAAIELARSLNSTYPNLEDVFKEASQSNPALRGLYFQVAKLYGLAKAVDS